MKLIQNIKHLYFLQLLVRNILTFMTDYDNLQKTELDEVINKFGEFFVGEMHEDYESYQLHLRK